MVKRYNIAIIPTPIVAEHAQTASEFVAGAEETCFVLDQSTRLPHISLYHIPLEESSIQEVTALLRGIAESLSPFSLESKGYHIWNGEWIDVSYELNETFFKLHMTILEAIAPLRIQKGDFDMKENWSDSSPARQENLELYSWSEARDLFRPHLTLTRLVGRVEEVFLESIPEKNFSFEATTLGLYELGEHGTCTKLLTEFVFDPLKL
jgi:2'-5' RNA ligase